MKKPFSNIVAGVSKFIGAKPSKKNWVIESLPSSQKFDLSDTQRFLINFLYKDSEHGKVKDNIDKVFPDIFPNRVGDTLVDIIRCMAEEKNFSMLRAEMRSNAQEQASNMLLHSTKGDFAKAKKALSLMSFMDDIIDLAKDNKTIDTSTIYKLAKATAESNGLSWGLITIQKGKNIFDESEAKDILKKVHSVITEICSQKPVEPVKEK